MNKISAFFGILSVLAISLTAKAEEIDKNTAQMQAMDKITGRVSKINVPVNGEVKFGSLSIVVRSCKTRPEEETPDNFAFADITDTTLQGDIVNIFRGWMISSSPATHAVEHPIYDVWLLKCLDIKVDEDKLLSEETLAARDEIEMQTAQENDVAQTDKKQPIAEIADVEHEENSDAPQGMEAVEFLYDEEETTDETGEQSSAQSESTVSESDEQVETANKDTKNLQDVISEIATQPE